jgi:hypothetical protein
MGYVHFSVEICPDGKSTGDTSALLEGVCGIAYTAAHLPPRNCTTAEFLRIQDDPSPGCFFLKIPLDITIDKP